MKLNQMCLRYNDLFYAVASIAEDNDLHTVDDLCDFLEQNPDLTFNIKSYSRGESNNK